MLCHFLTRIISKVQIFLYLLLLMVVNMYKHMGKVVIKILQGSAVTLTMLGGLTIHPPVANFLQCKCQSYCKNYQAYFFGPPCISRFESHCFHVIFVWKVILACFYCRYGEHSTDEESTDDSDWWVSSSFLHLHIMTNSLCFNKYEF